MKLLIFLLLLSGSCLGQINESKCEGRIACYYTNPAQYGLEGKHLPNCSHIEQVKLMGDAARAAYDAREGVMRKTKSIEKIEVKANTSCSHKWIELHQDTIPGRLPNMITAEPLMLIIPAEYESSIPLICLICHQEKKKVIHYKRSE